MTPEWPDVTVTDLPLDRIGSSVVAELHTRFPDCLVWFGSATGRWWALVRSRSLVEGAHPHELADAIDKARRRR